MSSSSSSSCLSHEQSIKSSKQESYSYETEEVKREVIVRQVGSDQQVLQEHLTTTRTSHTWTEQLVMESKQRYQVWMKEAESDFNNDGLYETACIHLKSNTEHPVLEDLHEPLYLLVPRIQERCQYDYPDILEEAEALSRSKPRPQKKTFAEYCQDPEVKWSKINGHDIPDEWLQCPFENGQEYHDHMDYRDDFAELKALGPDRYFKRVLGQILSERMVLNPESEYQLDFPLNSQANFNSNSWNVTLVKCYTRRLTMTERYIRWRKWFDEHEYHAENQPKEAMFYQCLIKYPNESGQIQSLAGVEMEGLVIRHHSKYRHKAEALSTQCFRELAQVSDIPECFQSPFFQPITEVNQLLEQDLQNTVALEKLELCNPLFIERVTDHMHSTKLYIEWLIQQPLQSTERMAINMQGFQKIQHCLEKAQTYLRLTNQSSE